MTSPNEPPKESIRDRISTRLATDKSGRLIDADAQHTRNINWMFYAIIGVIVVVIVGGLAFGYYDSNLKPLASVDGTDISRGDKDDRQELEAFRAERADALTSAALADGSIESDLANRRFNSTAVTHASDDATIVTDLVDYTFKSQLAAEAGVTLSADELDAAVAADGTFAEARFIDALIVLTAEQGAGLAATDAGIAEARTRAEAAAAELEAGADIATLVETYGPAQNESAYVAEDDLSDAAWGTQIFAAEEGDVTSPLTSSSGEQLIAMVGAIVPETADEGFVEAVNDAVGEDVHRRNVELETLAAKLEAQVTDEALAAEYDQVELAQIFIERSSGSTDDTVGEASASHILYQPELPLDDEGNATALEDLPADDPAWAAAEVEAQAAFDELSAIEDPEERVVAFADRARDESDGPSGPNGGDLGWFARESMVTEFADAIWENVDPQQADVLGPVRSDFGWHVIAFDQFRSSLDVRVAEAQAALAEDGADFATVAAEYSDGPEADEGGETGWQVVDQLDDVLYLTLSILEFGETTEPVDEGDGYYIYQKQDEGTRPLEDAAAEELAGTAFDEWYFERYDAADDEGRVSVDSSIYG
jgi:parvulin-like peptidyl-prolyl isomerase